MPMQRPGNYIVKLSSANDCKTINRTITIVLTSGLSDLTEKIAVRILPNPTPGDFRVELDSRMSAGSIVTPRRTGQAGKNNTNCC